MTARQWHPQLQASIVLPIDDLERKNASAPQPHLFLAAATATRCGEFLPHLASHIATHHANPSRIQQAAHPRRASMPQPD